MLIGSVEDDVKADNENVVKEAEVEEENDSIISLNSFIGITNPKTMKMLGRIGTEDLIVMIDPEASNNFISNEAVQKLGTTCKECERHGVFLGNGDEILGQGVCRRVTLQLQ